MTQTSGKTGPGVGVGREKRGSGGPSGGGVTSHPSFQAVEAQISEDEGRREDGGQDSKLSHLISIIRNGGQGGAGSAIRVIWGCKLDFSRHVTLSLNLAVLPADPRESQFRSSWTCSHHGAQQSPVLFP